MTFRFAGPITMGNAQASLAACTAAIDAGTADLALDALAHSDSSAVAVLIAAQRHAAAKGRTLSIGAVPEAVRSLATLYGVESFVGAPPSPTVTRIA